LFFPAKEVLSIYPGFITSYEDREVAFDETYYDLCKALNRFLLRGKRRSEIADWITPLESHIPGKLILEVNRFYLQLSEQEKREIPLVAEGIRKIAMLNYLILNGSLTKGSTLFWDEPEANLNAKLQVKLVDSLVQLANAGVQIVLTVHDLFLMKELSLRIEAGETKAYFFELLQEDANIRVVQGEKLDDLLTIVALEAALEQYDREQEVLLQDY
jgi:wobble nucleotide-excising tRNase